MADMAKLINEGFKSTKEDIKKDIEPVSKLITDLKSGLLRAVVDFEGRLAKSETKGLHSVDIDNLKTKIDSQEDFLDRI